MFDIAWSEMVLIGAVALVVIGPKDLPKALRTVGQAVGKMRRMAGEFQSQFNDAMRDAELDELKKQVENVGEQVKTDFQPIGQIDDFDKPKSASTTEPTPPAPDDSTAKLAALPAPEMPPPVEIPPAPVADESDAKPRRKRKVAAQDEPVAALPAPPELPALPAPDDSTAEDKPRRARKAKPEAEAAIPAVDSEPKLPRRRKQVAAGSDEGSAA